MLTIFMISYIISILLRSLILVVIVVLIVGLYLGANGFGSYIKHKRIDHEYQNIEESPDVCD